MRHDDSMLQALPLTKLRMLVAGFSAMKSNALPCTKNGIMTTGSVSSTNDDSWKDVMNGWHKRLH